MRMYYPWFLANESHDIERQQFCCNSLGHIVSMCAMGLQVGADKCHNSCNKSSFPCSQCRMSLWRTPRCCKLNYLFSQLVLSCFVSYWNVAVICSSEGPKVKVQQMPIAGRDRGGILQWMHVGMWHVTEVETRYYDRYHVASIFLRFEDHMMCSFSRLSSTCWMKSNWGQRSVGHWNIMTHLECNVHVVQF
jgi:hypothetical protein